ncbi:hypothetical protein P7K49_007658 [Saguinus oedipus]|uniref:Uncharacterized protein n=1 Tax=Saguinus oedipus TaxID=9490 RepID=A0ABQ9VZ55_SAGOE|nr:hypothetical protein P7K49_007658 [Saguinus oedipus]
MRLEEPSGLGTKRSFQNYDYRPRAGSGNMRKAGVGPGPTTLLRSVLSRDLPLTRQCWNQDTITTIIKVIHLSFIVTYASQKNKCWHTGPQAGLAHVWMVLPRKEAGITSTWGLKPTGGQENLLLTFSLPELFFLHITAMTTAPRTPRPAMMPVMGMVSWEGGSGKGERREEPLPQVSALTLLKAPEGLLLFLRRDMIPHPPPYPISG